jgi:hypothetical protein
VGFGRAPLSVLFLPFRSTEHFRTFVPPFFFARLSQGSQLFFSLCGDILFILFKQTLGKVSLLYRRHGFFILYSIMIAI